MSYSPSFRKFLFLFFAFLVYLSPKLSSGQGVLWGVTEKGGNGVGLIYRVNSDGTNQVVQKSLYFNHPGSVPKSRMTLAANGKLYGSVTKGGDAANGAIFEFDPTTNAYTKKFDFDAMAGTGWAASGGVVQAGNGRFYGTVNQGPAPSGDYGAIFELDMSTNAFVKKYIFNGSSAPNGGYPNTTLLVATNGKLYGTTSAGGVDFKGTLFEYDITTSTYQKKVDFGASGWKSEKCDLIQAPNGLIYGAAYVFSTGQGFLFEYNPTTNTITKKADDFSPTSQIEYYNNKIYGLGSNKILEYDLTSGTTTTRYTITNPVTEGAFFQGLIHASNGKLYGISEGGGTNIISTDPNTGCGIIFEFNLATGVFTKKYSFANNGTGTNPVGNLVEVGGSLYGVTQDFYSGAPAGKIFSFNLSTNETTIRFAFGDGSTGKYPQGGLTKASNGLFYGLAKLGGSTYNAGTMVAINPAFSPNDYRGFGTMTTFGPRITYTPSVGAFPEGGMTLAPNGRMYSITSSGGSYGYGTIFETIPGSGGIGSGTGSFSVKHHFTSAHSVEGGQCSFTLSTNGKLYGMTSIGGANNLGSIYEYVPGSIVITPVFSFSGSANGSTPYGSLVQASNGKMYGMTSAGGTNSNGVIFEFNPTTSAVTKLLDFTSSTSGSSPRGNLIQATNGKLYGMTTNGGSNGVGVLFEFDLSTTTYTKRVDFNSATSGANPYGTLFQSPNGKLYGTAYTGGVNNLGTLFEFDPIANVLLKKLDFNGSNGANPVGTFLYDAVIPPAQQTITFQAIPNKNYGDPAFDIVVSASSGLPVNLIIAQPTPNVVSLSGNTITILNPGPVTIYADQPGNASYYPAAQVQQSFTVSPITPIITFTSPSSGTVSTTVPLSVNKGGSTGAVTYSVTPGTGSANLSTSSILLATAGTITITANVAAQGVYGPGTATQEFTITGKQNQTINFPGITPVTRCVGSTFTLAATATSGLPVTFMSSSSSIASINGNTVTVNAAGNFTITASQVGSATFNAAPNVAQTFTGIAKPVSSIAPGGPTNFCQGSSVTLTANPGDAGNTYLWSTGATTRIISANTAGTFSVVVTNTTGCSSNSVSVTTTIKSTPAVYIVATYDLCTNGYTRLTATNVTGATSYSWSTGSTASYINVSSAGARTVSVTFSNGCTSTASYTVGVCAPPPDPCDPPIEATAAKRPPCEEQIALQKEKDDFLDQTSIYPNRANESMTISIPKPAKSDLKVFVYSQFGQEVFSGKIPTNSDNLFIDTRLLSIGMYMIHVEVPGGKKNEVVNRKVMIQH